VWKAEGPLPKRRRAGDAEARRQKPG
jgi:hypothetical protein